MQQVSSPQVDEDSVRRACGSDGHNRDQRRPLELLRAEKKYGRGIGKELKSILPGRFDGGKGAAIFGFDVLSRLLALSFNS